MGKDVHFDGLSYVKQQSCHRTVGLCCVLLCSYTLKDAQFDSFGYVKQQSCHRTVGLCCVLCSYIGKDVHFDGSVMLRSKCATLQLGTAVSSCAII
jgi:hypothetical protein